VLDRVNPEPNKPVGLAEIGSISGLSKEVTIDMTKKSLFIPSSVPILFFAVLFQLQNPVQAISGEGQRGSDTLSNGMSDDSSGKVVIGKIHTRDKILIIRSGAHGPLYTVKSRDGDLLAADLNIAELNAKFPELKEIAEKGLAGNDASLSMDNRSDIKIQVMDGIGK
jgi:hypothetical protein